MAAHTAYYGLFLPNSLKDWEASELYHFIASANGYLSVNPCITIGYAPEGTNIAKIGMCPADAGKPTTVKPD